MEILKGRKYHGPKKEETRKPKKGPSQVRLLWGQFRYQIAETDKGISCVTEAVVSVCPVGLGFNWAGFGQVMQGPAIPQATPLMVALFESKSTPMPKGMYARCHEILQERHIATSRTTRHLRGYRRQ